MRRQEPNITATRQIGHEQRCIDDEDPEHRSRNTGQ